MSDGIIIKEKVDLFNKVKRLFESQSHLFPPKYRNFSMTQLKNIPSQELKGILFEIYTKTGDTEAYERVNQRLRDYVVKINRTITEEGYDHKGKCIDIIGKIARRVCKGEELERDGIESNLDLITIRNV